MKVNLARLVVSIVVVAVVSWLFDFLYHGVGLGSQYKETAEAWRPEAEMMAWYPWQIACYFIIAIGFCTIWAVGFAPHGHGLKCGLIYGFFVGLIGNGGMLMMFVFVPIPTQFMAPWAIGGFLASILAGAVVALLYKPKAAEGGEAS